MGDPRKLRRAYEPPRHPWQAERIRRERSLIRDFGLKNKREIWRAEASLRRYRHLARQLVGKSYEQRKAEEEKLLGKLRQLGLLTEAATLDNVLGLKIEDLLGRRLQTLVWKRGMTATIEQARQFIVHGHIEVDGRKVTTPGTILDTKSEGLIGWHGEPVQVTMPAARKAEIEAAEKRPEAPKKAEEMLTELEEVEEKEEELKEEKELEG